MVILEYVIFRLSNICDIFNIGEELILYGQTTRFSDILPLFDTPTMTKQCICEIELEEYLKLKTSIRHMFSFECLFFLSR